MIKTLFGIITLLLIVGAMVVVQEQSDVIVPENVGQEVTGEGVVLGSDSAEDVATFIEQPSVNVARVRDLSEQGLTKVPAHIFDEVALQELNLSNNKLEGSLQAEVRHLKNLKVLNLSNNKFTAVPAEVGQLTNLEVLNLSNNQLTGLPYELGNLQNLKVLDLRGNAYSVLDLDIINASLPASTVVQVD